MADIKKSALICLENKKLLIVHKKTIDLYISPGGKNEPGESDHICLQREIREELGCKVGAVDYWDTYFDKTHDNKDNIELRCYFGDLIGKIKLNPNDSIDGYLWIGRNYDKNVKLASLLKHKIIPNLVNGGLM